MQTHRINGHHLGTVAGYIFNIIGNSESEIKFLKGYFRENVEEVRQLHKEMLDGAKILVVEGTDELCDLCHSDNHWSCRDEKWNYQLQEIDKNALSSVGFEIGKTYSLDDVLEKYKFLKPSNPAISK